MSHGVRFDTQGRVIIEDEEIAHQIVDWLQSGKEISLRLPYPSGVSPNPEPAPESPTATAAAIIVGPRPIPQPIPMLTSCPNSMCDCPIAPKILQPKVNPTAINPGLNT